MGKLNQDMWIKEAAEYLSVCQNTLRNWGRVGSITERRDPANNYRMYGKIDLDRLRRTVPRPVAGPGRAAR